MTDNLQAIRDRLAEVESSECKWHKRGDELITTSAELANMALYAPADIAALLALVDNLNNELSLVRETANKLLRDDGLEIKQLQVINDKLTSQLTEDFETIQQLGAWIAELASRESTRKLAEK
jgi:hypothetical protein